MLKYYGNRLTEEMVMSFYGVRERVIVTPGMPNTSTYVDIHPHVAIDQLVNGNFSVCIKITLLRNLD